MTNKTTEALGLFLEPKIQQGDRVLYSIETTVDVIETIRQALQPREVDVEALRVGCKYEASAFARGSVSGWNECIDHLHTQGYLNACDGWQDISTAPRDGTEVLLIQDIPSPVYFVGYYDDSDVLNPDHVWATIDGSYHRDLPTHWRPLPQPPTHAVTESED